MPKAFSDCKRKSTCQILAEIVTFAHRDKYLEDRTMNFPDKIRYSEDHEWIRVDGSEAIIGITDFAQSELGDIVFVDIPEVGIELAKGEVFGSIEAVKTVSDLILPASGELLEVNKLLEDNPETINSDPYDKGWIIRIRLKDPKEVDSLMDAAQYQAFIKK